MFAMMLAAMDTTIVSTAIPQIVDEVIDALHGADLSMLARQYLREAIGAATALPGRVGDRGVHARRVARGAAAL